MSTNMIPVSSSTEKVNAGINQKAMFYAIILNIDVNQYIYVPLSSLTAEMNA